MLRLAFANRRTNNQPATMATPTSEIHMIQSATVGFELLVRKLLAGMTAETPI